MEIYPLPAYSYGGKRGFRWCFLQEIDCYNILWDLISFIWWLIVLSLQWVWGKDQDAPLLGRLAHVPGSQSLSVCRKGHLSWDMTEPTSGLCTSRRTMTFLVLLFYATSMRVSCVSQDKCSFPQGSLNIGDSYPEPGDLGQESPL